MSCLCSLPVKRLLLDEMHLLPKEKPPFRLCLDRYTSEELKELHRFNREANRILSIILIKRLLK